MKRLGVLAAVLAIAASCSVNETEPEFVKAPNMFGHTEGEQATKTAITVDGEGVGTILWKPADNINVFFGTTSVRYYSTNEVDATTVVFETSAMIGSTESASDNKWGLYPYDASAICDGSSVTTTIPADQQCVPETFGNNLFPMIAHTSTNELHFKNVCGGIKFSLSRDDIQSITFRGNNNEDIVGLVQLTFNGEDDPVASVVAGEKTITLTPSAGATFESGTNYYLVMLPKVLSGGFTMTFETETEIGTFEYTAKTVEIKRSIFARKADIDTYAYFAPNFISFDDPEVKAVCLSHFDSNNDGILSYAEAAAVTKEQAAGCFTSNKNIRYFPELQYFTGITDLEEHDGSGFFEGCSSLESIILPPSLNSISDGAFQGCSSITSLSIPSSVRYLWGHILWGCTSLVDLYLNSSNPPELEGTFSKNEFESVTLHVPAGRVYAYESWLAYFGTITDGTNTIRNPRYVDLGLSVKWAEWNLGANSPEEYGYYYAWGETTPKATLTFSKNNYKFYSNYQYTKYVTQSFEGTVDNKRTLELADDAANVSLGGKWRMPTLAEAQELYDNCTWTKETLNGIKGYRVTSKVAGYTDKSIFFPYAGAYYNTTYQEDFGTYWTSSLSEYDCIDARNINMGDFEISLCIDYDPRTEGRPIRPVYE